MTKIIIIILFAFVLFLISLVIFGSGAYAQIQTTLQEDKMSEFLQKNGYVLKAYQFIENGSALVIIAEPSQNDSVTMVEAVPIRLIE